MMKDENVIDKLNNVNAINLLCDVDFEALDKLNPSLIGGWRIIYDREIPGEVRVKESLNDTLDEIGSIEPINLKIFIKGSEENPITIKVEITSENDLFLHYVFSIDQQNYKEFSTSQHLLVDMFEFPTVLIKMGNSCIRDPANYIVIIMLYIDGTGDLSFIQNAEYKFVELLRLPLTASTEDVIRQSISYRHNSIKARLLALHTRIQDICGVIHKENPELLKAIAQPLFGGPCSTIYSPYNDIVTKNCCDKRIR